MDNRMNEDDKDFYFERGQRVRRGSKLDKAIRQFKKKGYFSTSLGGTSYKQWRPDSPTLRPSFFGSTTRTNHHHHPLDESEHRNGKFANTVR